MATIMTIQDLSTLNGSVQNVTVALTPNDRRLIAAAPELLEALRKLAAWVDAGDAGRAELERRAANATGGNVGHLEAVMDTVHDAIAKATGEPNNG